jgi:hypothetical protein
MKIIKEVNDFREHLKIKCSICNTELKGNVKASSAYTADKTMAVDPCEQCGTQTNLFRELSNLQKLINNEIYKILNKDKEIV